MSHAARFVQIARRRDFEAVFEQILCASVVPVLLSVGPGIGALYMTLFTALATSNWATTALGLRW